MRRRTYFEETDIVLCIVVITSLCLDGEELKMLDTTIFIVLV